jgi:hypothetical protein
VEGSCEHGNDSIECWEILEWPHNWRLLERESVPWSESLFCGCFETGSGRSCIDIWRECASVF